MCSERYPEVAAVVAQIGRPDDGTDPGLFNNAEVFVPLRPEREWPVVDRPNGQRMKRSRRELVTDMNAELSRKLPGIEWQFSQYIRDNVMEAISGVKADNCVKIFGPDLEKLEELAEKTKAEMGKVRGLHDLGIYRIMGQTNLEFVVDKDKCQRYGVQVADVNNVINSAVHGNAVTQMVEGEKLFDITVRWPFSRRWDRTNILEIPVDISNNAQTAGSQTGVQQNNFMGPSNGPAATGSGNAPPTNQSQFLPYYPSGYTPRLYLKNFVSPVSRVDWRADPDTKMIEAGKLTAAVPLAVHPLNLVGGKTYIFAASSNDFAAETKLLDFAGKKVWPPTSMNGSSSNGKNGRGNGAMGWEAPDLGLSYTPRTDGYFKLVVSPIDTEKFSDDLKKKKADSFEYTATIRALGGDFSRPAGSIITREEGKRFIAVKFSVHGDRDLASVVHDVREKTKDLYPAPYYITMGGEFEQMEDGERRLLLIIPASLVLIFMLLYVAFNSLLDAVVILSNVLDLAVGGIWALYLTGTNFSISAAVGFVSLFGVAIMDGLLMIAYFNDLRAKGQPVDEAIMHGAALRVRPVTMTCLTAILGLLPAAFSTAIGAQTQRPLAIVVVGGMLSTLFLTRYLMPVLYSFYGHRTPPAGASSMAH
jgi:Cu/Ag efflux pump CusA